MIMEMLESTAGAVGGSTMCVTAAFAHPAAQAAGSHLLVPTVRIHSLAGVGLYEVRGSDKGWVGQWTGSDDAAKSTDPTAFPNRLGPPPDSPPVN